MKEQALAVSFDNDRARLRALSFRMLGSVEDAEDAIQRAWMKTARSEFDDVANLSGWFTTVVSRECLDMLRARRRRNELSINEELATADRDITPSAEEEVIRIESVSRALFVVLERLSPAQRVAFVLHDLFAVPFEEIALILNRTPTAAKKLASRARQQIGPHAVESTESAVADLAVVEAFLKASRDGDIVTLVHILAPDVVRRADATLLPSGVATEVLGAQAVAEETKVFAPRARVGVVMMIDGAPGIVVAPGGRLRAVLRVAIRHGQIHGVDLADEQRSRAADITLVN
jgi:RNA polymerase sigma factor (sigma-70 family)